MVPKISPAVPVAIRARIAHLRRRKIALDAVISSLETYAALTHPPHTLDPRSPAEPSRRWQTSPKWAGAAWSLPTGTLENRSNYEKPNGSVARPSLTCC